MDARVGLDVVVVNYQTPDDLQRFLTSLDDAVVNVPYTVTIVNVEPGGGDLAVAANWCRKPHDRAVVRDYRFLNYGTNIGYNRACNIAADIGAGEVIALFNADVQLTPPALDECRVALLANDKWGLLGPRQSDRQGRMTAAGIFGTLDKPQHRGWHQPDRQTFHDIRDDAVMVAGSALFVKRRVWRSLAACRLYLERGAIVDGQRAEGPMLEARHYYGDTWLAYHAAAHGWRSVYYGPCRIVHDAHGADRSCSFGRVNHDHDRDLFRAACKYHRIPCN
jgi:GT2 family glycosyltransferase